MNQFFIWAHNQYSQMIGENNDIDTNSLFQMILDLTDQNISKKQFCDAYDGGEHIYNEYHEGMEKKTLPFSENDVKNQISICESYFAQQNFSNAIPFNLQNFPNAPIYRNPFFSGEYYEEEDYVEEEEYLEENEYPGNNKHFGEKKFLEINKFLEDDDYFEEEEEEEEEEMNDEAKKILIKSKTEAQKCRRIETDEEQKFKEEFKIAFKKEFRKTFEKELKLEDENKENQRTQDNKKIFINDEIKQKFKKDFHDAFKKELIHDETGDKEMKEDKNSLMDEQINGKIKDEFLNLFSNIPKETEKTLRYEEEDENEEEEEGEEEENNDLVEIEFNQEDTNGEHIINVIVPPYIQKMCQKYIPPTKIQIDTKNEDTIDIEFYRKDEDNHIIIPPQIQKLCQKVLPQHKEEIELSFDLGNQQYTSQNLLEHENDGKLHLYALNVGYGNLIILSIGTKAIIFDAGSAELTKEMETDNGCIPSPFIIPATTILKSKQIEIVIITHPTKDRFNLLKTVLNESDHDINNIQFICGGYEQQYEEFDFNNRQFSLDLNNLDVDTIILKKQEFETMLNSFFRKEGVYFNFLLPAYFRENPTKCKDNDYSNLLITIDYYGKRILIPGSSTQKTIKSLNYYDSQYLKNVDIFVVPNHGLCSQTIYSQLFIKSKLAIISCDPKFYQCYSLGCPQSKRIIKLSNTFDSKAPLHKLYAFESNTQKPNNSPIELGIDAPIFSVSNNYFKYNNFCFNGIHLSVVENNEIEFEFRKPKIQTSTTEFKPIQLK